MIYKTNTTKKTNYELELTRKDNQKFKRYCLENGTTPEKVLEGFINDLINGNYTNGSDERDLAHQYFDRCCYGLGEITFLQYLIQNLLLDDYIYWSNELDYILDCFDEEINKEEKEKLREAERKVNEEIRKMWQLYVEKEKPTSPDFKEEIELIEKYVE